MAQFGTIADWLEYDRIKLAQTEQNILGRAVGELGAGIGDALGDYTPDEPESPDIARKKISIVPYNFKPGIVTPDFDKLNEYLKPNNITTATLKDRPPTDDSNDSDDIVEDEPVKETNAANSEANERIDILAGPWDAFLGADNTPSNEVKIPWINPFSSDSDDSAKVNTRKGSSSRRRKKLQSTNSSIQRNLDQAAAYYEEKFNIKSPIKRIGRDGMDDQARSESVQSRGYIYNPATGKANTSFAEGYNARLIRDSRKRQVWDNAAKSLDDAISATTVEPSGFNMLDGALQMLGSQMQQSYLDLKNNKYDMQPEEFKMLEAKAVNMPKQINQTMQVLTQRVKDFEENRSSLSKATPTTTVEILDSLAKNEGTLRPIIENGVPYLAGKTYAGTDVKVAMSEITNGKNDFKFFKQADLNEPLQGLVDKYSKLKTEAEFRSESGSGLVKTTIPIESFKNSIMSDFDTLLSDENTLRTVVSDYMGADFDTFEEIKASGNDPKEMAKNQLYSMFENKWAPYSEQKDITSYQRNENQSGGRNTAAERNRLGIQQYWQKLPNPTSDNIMSFQKDLATGYSIGELDGNYYVIDKNGNTQSQPIDFSNPSNAKAQLARFAKRAGYSFENKSNQTESNQVTIDSSQSRDKYNY
jgi:hypothetical protein